MASVKLLILKFLCTNGLIIKDSTQERIGEIAFVKRRTLVCQGCNFYM